jgi:hypothetical protein
MENDIHLTYQIGECQEFTRGGEKKTISIVIAPLKMNDNGKEISLKSGCNMWKACQNEGCGFSQVAYGGPKKN